MSKDTTFFFPINFRKSLVGRLKRHHTKTPGFFAEAGRF